MAPRLWIILSLIFHLITPYFSVGYYFFDEYFQTVEFASYKLGLTPSSALSWEFPAQMRSWFLPGLVYILIKIARGLGIESAQWQMYFVQLLFSLLGWSSLVYFYKTLIKTEALEKSQTLIWKWVALFWFFPFFHARTSSENVSTSLWLIGFCFFIHAKEKVKLKTFIASLFFGFSFLCRFQSAFMTLGLFAWKMRTLRPSRSLQFYGISMLGLLCAYSIGMGFDYWGYGNWTQTTWNYLHENLIKHRLDHFGVSPWWYYFKLFFDELPLGFGVLIPLTLVLGCFFFSSHPLIWTTLPFLIIHFCIGHKELRFLFPIFSFIPYLFYRFEALGKDLLSKKLGFAYRWFWISVQVACILMIPPTLFKAQSYRFRFLSYISAHYSSSFHLAGWIDDPYQIAFPNYFYRPREYRYTKISSPKELETLIQSSNQVFVARPTNELPNEYARTLSQCELVYEVFPKIFQSLNMNNWLSRTENWGLYSCKK